MSVEMSAVGSSQGWVRGLLAILYPVNAFFRIAFSAYVSLLALAWISPIGMFGNFRDSLRVSRPIAKSGRLFFSRKLGVGNKFARNLLLVMFVKWGDLLN